MSGTRRSPSYKHSGFLGSPRHNYYYNINPFFFINDYIIIIDCPVILLIEWQINIHSFMQDKDSHLQMLNFSYPITPLTVKRTQHNKLHYFSSCIWLFTFCFLHVKDQDKFSLNMSWIGNPHLFVICNKLVFHHTFNNHHIKCKMLFRIQQV